MASEEAARAYDVVISDLQACADGHAQDEFEHQRKKLTMSKELSDLKGSYHDVTSESEERLTLEITNLRRDSDEVCEDLSISRAKCVKLEEDLKVALKDADESRVEAQDLYMRLITSKREVKRLGSLNLEAEKHENANYKRSERLGVKEAELLEI